jgi:hypothetical protein
MIVDGRRPGRIEDLAGDRLPGRQVRHAIDLLVEPESRPRRSQFESLRLAERILRRYLRLIDVDALDDQILLDGPGRRGARREIGAEIRDVLQAGEPVESLLQVRVEERAADVLERSVGVDRAEDLLVSQLIAPQRRDTAGDAGAEVAARGDANRRLAERVEAE